MQPSLIESRLDRIVSRHIADGNPVFGEPPLSAEPLCFTMLGMRLPRSNRFVRLELDDGEFLAISGPEPTSGPCYPSAKISLAIHKPVRKPAITRR
jgi:hypothetical protein